MIKSENISERTRENEQKNDHSGIILIYKEFYLDK